MNLTFYIRHTIHTGSGFSRKLESESKKCSPDSGSASDPDPCSSMKSTSQIERWHAREAQMQAIEKEVWKILQTVLLRTARRILLIYHA